MDSGFSVAVSEDKRSSYVPRFSTISWELFLLRRALFKQRFCALDEQYQIIQEQFKGWRYLPLPFETRRIFLAAFKEQCLQIRHEMQQIRFDLRHEQLSLAEVWQELGWQRDDLERWRSSQSSRVSMR